MDGKHGIQHIDVEYGVVILATPSPEDDVNVCGGYGSMCVWQAWQRLAAYKSMRSWLDCTIAEMEAEL